MKTKEKVKIIVENVFQLTNEKVEKLTDYIIDSRVVYAVCEGPDDYNYLEESYEYK